MRITGFESNAELLSEIGSRLRDARVDARLTQAELAERAGVSLRTITNVEAGNGATLVAIANIMRALGMLSRFDLLVPERETRPSELLAHPDRKCKRVVRSRKTDGSSTAWVWGEDL